MSKISYLNNHRQLFIFCKASVGVHDLHLSENFWPNKLYIHGTMIFHFLNTHKVAIKAGKISLSLIELFSADVS